MGPLIPNSDGLREGGWIQGAIKHPGALHDDLGVPRGKKIPVSMIRDAAKAKGTLGRRARLALTLRKISAGRKRKSAKTQEVNRCHGKGRGHPCQTGAALQMRHDVEDGYVHRLTFTRGGSEVGHIEYTVSTGKVANIEYIGVSKALRGQGIGEQMYRDFATEVAKAGATSVGGEVTSKGVFRLRNRVFGTPEMISDDIDNLSMEEAMSRLPDASPENAEGVIDGGPHVFVRHTLPRRRRA